MKNEQRIRLKVVLVKKEKTSKRLCGRLGKAPSTEPRWCSNILKPSMGMPDEIRSLLGVDKRELLNKNKWQ